MNAVERVLIIGNTGAGKSHLAKALAECSHLPLYSLDDFHWLAGGFDQKRDRDEARRLACAAAAGQSWIVEGVFGWLADEVVDRAEALIWLDLQWESCADGLRAREIISGAHWLWAEDYWRRATSSSYAGHASLFLNFCGVKRRFVAREDADALIDKQNLGGLGKTILL